MTTPGSHGPGEQPSSGFSGWGPPAGVQQPGAVPPPPPPGAFPQGAYPPPQGQFPQGSYPPPQGQFPQGSYPPPQGAVAPGQGWTPPQPAQSGAAKWIGIIGGLVAIVAGLVAVFSSFGGGDPEVGDCLQEDGRDLVVVDCDDTGAAWRLIGIQDGEQGYDEYLADLATCSAFPGAVQSFWVGENGDASGQGRVFCVTGV